jgi:hypothetical protein
MMAMTLSIMITIMMMMVTAILINYMEGDILPDTSPWSFIQFQQEEEMIRND